MRILLIDPPYKRFTGYVNYFFPIGLATIAAVLSKAGHEVRVFDVDALDKGSDLNFSNEYKRLPLYVEGINNNAHPVWGDIRRVLEKYKPDAIGITIMTQKFGSAIKTAEICKLWNKNIPIIAGGPHATIDPNQVLESKVFDHVVKGEGEFAFLDLIGSLKNNSDFENVIERKFVENLDIIPFPDRELLMHPDKYSSEDMGVIMSSRGCPYKCTYCFHMWQRKLRFRSADNVFQEIKMVKEKYGTRQFAFKDDTFTVNRKRLFALCEKLISENLNINWECTTRVDVLTEDMLRIMARAGCNIIKIGVESGSEKILRETKKGVTLKQIRSAAKLLNKVGIFWSAYFMMGLPQETEEDILETFRFVKELNPLYAGLGVYNPMPSTELFDSGVEMGLLYDRVEIDHFFGVNPKDYYFRDPKKRVAYINPQRFVELTDFMMREFHKHNTRFFNIARRGWIRRRAYKADPGLFVSDCKKVASWLSKD
ncbi:MAG: B12-binding domain-containing radical SAM protein [Candidatus Saganbacteria bacterium]|nr:B12-binding domain-containing radical SAM protein [Candidatus Saganbacteria bacterium]